MKSIGEKISDVFFLIILGVYLLYSMSTTSTFFLPYPGNFAKYLFAVLLCSAVLRCIFAVPTYLDKSDIKRCTVIIGGGLWISCVYLMVYRADRFSFLLFLGVITVGCVGLDYQRLLKLYVVLMAIFLGVTTLSSMGGAIENYVYMKDGFIRSSCGICYPTDLASSLFFFLLIFWVTAKKIPDEVTLVLALAGAWVSRVIAMSVTSTFCFMLFSVMLTGRIIYQRNTFAKKVLDKQKTVGSRVMILSFPILAVLMFLLIAAYAKGINAAYVVDRLLSSRLRYAFEVYKDCGITLFGTPFAQNGNGFSKFSSTEYSFVDSTYPLILLRYGLVLFLTYCYIWPRTVSKALCANDWRLALAMTLIAIHSFSEHHFIEVNFNLLVAMPFASYMPARKEIEDEASLEVKLKALFSDRRGMLAASVTVFLMACVLVMFLPGLSRARTLAELLGWTNGKYGVDVLRYFGCWLGGLFLMMLALRQGILAFRKNSLRFRGAVFGGAVCLCALGGMAWQDETILREAAEEYEPIIREETEALEHILELAEGDVYVNSIPELYRRILPELKTSVFYKDELARCYNITAVMDRQYDSQCFINSGFLFAPISSRYAIYTNDQSLIQALQREKVHLTGYYNEEKFVNLQQMAWANGLRYDSENRITVDGPEASLRYGPYLSLYSGVYSVWFDLSLPDDIWAAKTEETKEDEFLGTLRITGKYGEQEIKEQRVYKSHFDEEGKCSLELRFWIGDYAGMEFLTQMEPGKSFRIDAIRYARTPDYDIHSFYNANRQKYRDEYYSLEGERITLPEGYASCEYEYNYDWAVNEIRYYDENNDPVMIKAGYAQLKRELDSKNRIIREEYYDTESNPVILPQGYAANEREYDDNNNAIIQRYYNTEGDLVVTTWNYAEVHRDFDEEHRIMAEYYFGTDGEPMLLPGGQAGDRRIYDTEGRLITQRFIGLEGEPVMVSAGYAEIHREYNGKNQIVREYYCDTDGRLLTMPQGYAYNEREYDAAGNASVQRYCDASGNRVMTTWNYAELHREFDENRRIRRESYFDVEGQPILLPTGQAEDERTYDDAGRLIIQKFKGLNGELIRITAGYAEVHREYNENNQISREYYCDTDGQLLTMPQGYAYNEREYDNAGNVSVQRYLDSSGNPVMTTWNYAEVHRVFDEKRQVVRESYFGVDGKPVNMPQGYAINEREYDEAGNASVQKFMDAAGTPVITTWNFAEVHRVFDEHRWVIRENYYNVDGMPMTLPAGHAGYLRTYDDKGRFITQVFLGLDDAPAMLNVGYAEVHREYDDAGNVSVERFYDTCRNPVITVWHYSEIHREYDGNRRVVHESYYGTDGKPILLLAGYASLRREYNDAGEQSAIRYYDLEGKEVTPAT